MSFERFDQECTLTSFHRKLGDHTYLTWNSEQPSGVSTGRDNRFTS